MEISEKFLVLFLFPFLYIIIQYLFTKPLKNIKQYNNKDKKKKLGG